MCTYNITLNDEVLSETRRSFASESAMDAWLQQQVEALLVTFNARQAAKARSRQAIEAMRRQSEQNGNAQMSLDEINNEIRLARDEEFFDKPLDEDFFDERSGEAYYPDMDKELYTPEEAYEMTMKDIKAIYDEEYAV